MDTPDMKGLEDFAESSDRDSAPFFVGREGVLQNINYTWQSRMKKWRQGNESVFSSATRVVQGAPGAGKTSLGQHLKSIWGREGTKNGTPIVVTLSTEALNTPLIVFKSICEKIKPDALGKLTTVKTVQRTTGGGLNTFAKAERQHQSTRKERDDPPAEWLDLRLALGDHQWTRPVCLLIDEAQTLDHAGLKFLKTMHTGAHLLPVFALLLGLGSTRTILIKGGLSRPESGSVHTLPSLAREETEELCKRYFRAFGIKGSLQLKRTVSIRLHAWSDGWPSHMHNALKGLSQELLRVKGDLGKVDPEQSLDQARIYRQEYYCDRLGDLFRTSEIFLGQFMATVPPDGSIMGKDILPLIQGAQKEAIRLGDQTMAKHSAVSLFQRLLHQGFLQPDHGNTYVCPIPSLRRWCLEQAGMEIPQDLKPDGETEG